ncbi:uncharacterized protein LOC134279526 [Saccostrea cucullata]|uniref:uncharacterized protein LOC134279526 n=1 Tax=Saccostrea cuccullata TaxID=36930 RepID=UPI002ED36CBE
MPNGSVIKFDKKWNQEKWLWIRNEYRNFLTYSEDVNVFSFGLLGYDFLCFDKGDPSASVIMHKSSISHVIIAIVIIVYLYFPMVMHFSAPQGESKLMRGILLFISLIQFPFNVFLVILSTFCPIVSTFISTC